MNISETFQNLFPCNWTLEKVPIPSSKPYTNSYAYRLQNQITFGAKITISEKFQLHI